MRDSRPVIAYIAAGIAVASAVAMPVWAASGTEAQAGKAKAAQCSTCHGPDGIAKVPDAPNLAGQNEIYLVKALNDYKSGARKHEVMSMMTQNLSASDIQQLAAYYSSIPITVKAP